MDITRIALGFFLIASGTVPFFGWLDGTSARAARQQALTAVLSKVETHTELNQTLG